MTFTRVPRAVAQTLVNRCWLPGKLPAGTFWMAEGNHLETLPSESQGAWVFNERDGTITTFAYTFDPVMKRKKRRRLKKPIEGQLALL